MIKLVRYCIWIIEADASKTQDVYFFIEKYIIIFTVTFLL